MARIFVSSTYLDLRDFRRQVELVIRKMGHEDVAMEYYVAEDQRPLERCLKDVAACDLYIGIFAWRYGWIPKKDNPAELSITELEYREAVKADKPRLVFLLSDEAPWPLRFIDEDRERMKKLRSELGEERVCGDFNSADSLGTVVAEAIHKWDRDTGQTSGRPLVLELDGYYDAIRRRYQTLSLEGLTPPQKEEYLQIRLSSVFVEQNVREEAPPVELPKEMWEKLAREEDIHPEDFPEGIALDEIRHAREIYYEKSSQPVLSVLIDPHYQRVVILGDPGSGKSTLTQYILLSLMGATGEVRLRRAFGEYLPLLVELREYASLCADAKCDTILEFIEYSGNQQGWHLTKSALQNYLKQDGRAIMIFDGLDEIFDAEDRERITRQIVGFSSDFPKVRVVVTSRVIGYRRKILKDAG